MQSCQYLIKKLENRVCNLFSFPGLATFHDLASRLHQFEIKFADNFSESDSQFRLTFEEIIGRKLFH